jgi:phosphomannomutase
MKPLKIGVSGIRGIVGEAFSPEVVLKFAQSFGTLMKKGKILTSRDTRTSGYMYKALVKAGLLSTGSSCIDLDICPTPTTQIMVKELKADGAVIVTASHNPIAYNGLKFINNKGLFLNDIERKKLLEIYRKGKFAKVRAEDINPIDYDESAIDRHLELTLNFIKPHLIRKRGFKVAYDCCNGAGSIITSKLMEKLGVSTVALNNEPNGLFPHSPEPVPKNLRQLCKAVRQNKCDIGFAQDPDADRLAIIDERGRPIGEEYTLALAVKFILKKNPGGVVVTNLSTTRAIDEVAKEFGAKVIRTKVGEINVVEKLIQKKGLIGGEGNGGVILPAIHPCRDSITAMTIVLEYMAREKKPLSEILADIPQYKIIKKALSCSSREAQVVIRELQEKYSSEKINTLDGIKIDFKDAWVHIRPSNTEPIVRIIAESKTFTQAQKLIDRMIREINEIRQLAA